MEIPKCNNCKFAGHNVKDSTSNDACFDPNRYDGTKESKYTTNSKHFTHCNHHVFVTPNKQYTVKQISKLKINEKRLYNGRW